MRRSLSVPFPKKSGQGNRVRCNDNRIRIAPGPLCHLDTTGNPFHFLKTPVGAATMFVALVPVANIRLARIQSHVPTGIALKTIAAPVPARLTARSLAPPT